MRVINAWHRRVEAWLRSLGDAAPNQGDLTRQILGNVKPDERLIGSLLQAHYKAVGDLAGELATRRVIDAMMGRLRVGEAFGDVGGATPPPNGEAFTLPWSTPSSRYDKRKAAGLGPRTGVGAPNQDGRTTLQERLARGEEWNATLGRLGFNLRDPQILAELYRRGTLIKGDVSRTMLEDLRDVLAQQFYKEGQSPAQVAKDIHRIFPMTYWGRAETIARTETGFAQQVVQQACFTRDGVPQKEWHASMRNTRDTHRSAHGQIQATDRPFFVGGVYMMHPCEPGAPAREVINCNCDSLPVFPADVVAMPQKPWLGEARSDV